MLHLRRSGGVRGCAAVRACLPRSETLSESRATLFVSRDSLGHLQQITPIARRVLAFVNLLLAFCNHGRTSFFGRSDHCASFCVVLRRLRAKQTHGRNKHAHHAERLALSLLLLLLLQCSPLQSLCARQRRLVRASRANVARRCDPTPRVVANACRSVALRARCRRHDCPCDCTLKRVRCRRRRSHRSSSLCRLHANVFATFANKLTSQNKL